MWRPEWLGKSFIIVLYILVKVEGGMYEYHYGYEYSYKIKTSLFPWTKILWPVVQTSSSRTRWTDTSISLSSGLRSISPWPWFQFSWPGQVGIKSGDYYYLSLIPKHRAHCTKWAMCTNSPSAYYTCVLFCQTKQMCVIQVLLPLFLKYYVHSCLACCYCYCSTSLLLSEWWLICWGKWMCVCRQFCWSILH